MILFQLSDSNTMSYGHNNNNNNNNNNKSTTSRSKSQSNVVIIPRKPSISDSKEENNNNNYTDMDTAHSDLKNNNNNQAANAAATQQNSVTLYGVNGSSSFPANIEPNGFVNMQPVGTKRPRYLSPPPTGANFNQQYPQGRQSFRISLPI